MRKKPHRTYEVDLKHDVPYTLAGFVGSLVVAGLLFLVF